MKRPKVRQASLKDEEVMYEVGFVPSFQLTELRTNEASLTS